jgi:hypothetical protein
MHTYWVARTCPYTPIHTHVDTHTCPSGYPSVCSKCRYDPRVFPCCFFEEGCCQLQLGPLSCVVKYENGHRASHSSWGEGLGLQWRVVAVHQQYRVLAVHQQYKVGPVHKGAAPSQGSPHCLQVLATLENIAHGISSHVMQVLVHLRYLVHGIPMSWCSGCR